MIYHSIHIKDKEAFVLPLGDLHIGDKGFTHKSRAKLQEKIDFVKSHKNAYVIGMGDLINCATRASKSSPFEQDMNLEEQIESAVNLFKPIKDKIIGLINGNHENRLTDFIGYSPTISICDRLGVKYLGDSAVIQVGVGVHKLGIKREEPALTYVIYMHHTSGGGSTLGGKINRTEKLSQVVVNADLFFGGHSHNIGVNLEDYYIVDTNSKTISQQTRYIVDCGGYLEYRGYVERGQMQPLPIGSPVVWLKGTRSGDYTQAQNKQIKVDVNI